MTTRGGGYAALLRGVNVGGHGKLAMKDLVELFVELGCTDVTTYIQSGNVVFRARAALATRLPAKASAAIQLAFDLEVPVVVRSADDLRAVASANPFLRRRADPKTLHVGFLGSAPTAEAVAKLDPNRSAGDSFVVQDSEIYFALGNGVGKTKLTTAYLETRLETTVTLRNWNTVLELQRRTAALCR